MYLHNITYVSIWKLCNHYYITMYETTITIIYTSYCLFHFFCEYQTWEACTHGLRSRPISPRGWQRARTQMSAYIRSLDTVQVNHDNSCQWFKKVTCVWFYNAISFHIHVFVYFAIWYEYSSFATAETLSCLLCVSFSDRRPGVGRPAVRPGQRVGRRTSESTRLPVRQGARAARRETLQSAPPAQ